MRCVSTCSGLTSDLEFFEVSQFFSLSFQPPGCVFDLAMATLTEEFIISFVRNDDVGRFILFL
jgi:hypothetical protein